MILQPLYLQRGTWNHLDSQKHREHRTSVRRRHLHENETPYTQRLSQRSGRYNRPTSSRDLVLDLLESPYSRSHRPIQHKELDKQPTGYYLFTVTNSSLLFSHGLLHSLRSVPSRPKGTVFHLVTVNFDSWRLTRPRQGYAELASQIAYVARSKATLITLIQPKTYWLSTFRLHVGSLHQDWLLVPVVSM